MSDRNLELKLPKLMYVNYSSFLTADDNSWFVFRQNIEEWLILLVEPQKEAAADDV